MERRFLDFLASGYAESADQIGDDQSRAWDFASYPPYDRTSTSVLSWKYVAYYLNTSQLQADDVLIQIAMDGQRGWLLEKTTPWRTPRAILKAWTHTAMNASAKASARSWTS